ncbi:ERI1 exoribonuclease family member 3 [Balamuthia mandrillaris]
MQNWGLPSATGFGDEQSLLDELDHSLSQANRRVDHEAQEDIFESESESDEEEPEEEEEGHDFDYLCVLDFEACREKIAEKTEDREEEWLYEITEFPVLLFNTRSLKVEAEYHRFVRPVKITQALVDRYVDKKYGSFGKSAEWNETAQPLDIILADFHSWLLSHHLLEHSNEQTEQEQQRKRDQSYRFAFVTCGDWDLKQQLPRNAHLLGMYPPPAYMQCWINIKEAYGRFYQKRRNPSGMKTMLNQLNIKLEGVHHYGLDDCHNIAKVLRRMLEDGCKMTKAFLRDDAWTPPSAGGKEEK